MAMLHYMFKSLIKSGFDWQYIIVHHSAGPDGNALDYHTLERVHIKERGYDDIGYHYVIENVAGKPEALVGRSLTKEGAHCKMAGMNFKGIGVCFIGNYSLAKPPVDLVMRGLNRVILPLCKIYGIGWHEIIGHGEVTGATTECPGLHFNMDLLREEVRKMLSL